MKKIVSFFGKDNKTFACLNRQAKEYARSKGLDFEWSIQEPYCAEDVIARLQDADAGIIDIEPYGENIFPHICHRTKLLVRFGVGYDKVDLGAASKYGIAIARTTGANTMGVAEMTVTLMLAARRELNFNQSVAASGSWGRRSISNETVGGTIGIVGFGAVGQAVARLVSGFGCRVLVYNPRPKPEAEALGAESGVKVFQTVVLQAVRPHLHGIRGQNRVKQRRFQTPLPAGAVFVHQFRDRKILHFDRGNHRGSVPAGGHEVQLFHEVPEHFEVPAVQSVHGDVFESLVAVGVRIGVRAVSDHVLDQLQISRPGGVHQRSFAQRVVRLRSDGHLQHFDAVPHVFEIAFFRGSMQTQRVIRTPVLVQRPIHLDNLSRLGNFRARRPRIDQHQGGD